MNWSSRIGVVKRVATKRDITSIGSSITFKELGKCHGGSIGSASEAAHWGKRGQVAVSSVVAASCWDLFIWVNICSSWMRTFNWFTSNLGEQTAMGVPNSREYNYYHGPDTPFKCVFLRSEYRFMCGLNEILSCFFFASSCCSLCSVSEGFLYVLQFWKKYPKVG